MLKIHLHLKTGYSFSMQYCDCTCKGCSHPEWGDEDKLNEAKIQKIDGIHTPNPKNTFQKLANKFRSEQGQLQQEQAEQYLYQHLHQVFPSTTAVGKTSDLTDMHGCACSAWGCWEVMVDLFGFLDHGGFGCSLHLKYFLAESCEVWHIWQSLPEYSSSCVGMYLPLMGDPASTLLPCHQGFIFTVILLQPQ